MSGWNVIPADSADGRVSAEQMVVDDDEGYLLATQRLLEGAGADVVFMPSVGEMYPPGFDDWVEVTGPLTERLEGAARPGHLRGVTTVGVYVRRPLTPEEIEAALPRAASGAVPVLA